jgi:hypothetical protein
MTFLKPRGSPLDGSGKPLMHTLHTTALIPFLPSLVTSHRKKIIHTHINAQRDIPITSISLKLLCHQLERDERDVRVVHGLQGDTLVGTVEVAIGDEFLDGCVVSAVTLSIASSLCIC